MQTVAVLSTILVTLTISACASGRPPRASTVPDPSDPGQLWQEPADISTLDLFYGAGGRDAAPDPDATFEFVAHKTSGKNPGYEVRDRSWLLWSVKLGEEAQSEVTSSRILWAMGFHQPAVYYLAQWTLSGQESGPQGQGRFRAEPADQQIPSDWSWYENPFVGTQPFRGLVVAQLILNSWDLKTSNNKIYEIPDPDRGIRRQYVVRDLGASLGSAKQFPLYKWLLIRDKQGTKNDLAGFEAQGFIESARDGRIEFAYSGVDEPLVRTVTRDDVVWTCELLSRLSDQQWQDAFRAGGYTVEERDRYTRKIKEKIAQGLQLRESVAGN